MRARLGATRCATLVVLVIGLVGAPYRQARGAPPVVARADTEGDTAEPPKPPKLDLNTATLAELDELPGVGRKKAEAIVARRKVQPFQRVTELLRVKGFGPKLFRRVRPFIEVSVAP